MCQVNIYEAEDWNDADEHVCAMEEDGWHTTSLTPRVEGGKVWVVMQRASCPTPTDANARALGLTEG